MYKTVIIGQYFRRVSFTRKGIFRETGVSFFERKQRKQRYIFRTRFKLKFSTTRDWPSNYRENMTDIFDSMTGCRGLTRHQETKNIGARLLFHGCVFRRAPVDGSPSLSTFNWWTPRHDHHHDHHRSSSTPDSLIFSRCPARISEFDRAVCHRPDSLHGTAEWTVVYVHAPSNITDYDALSPAALSPLPAFDARAKGGVRFTRRRLGRVANERRKRATEMCLVPRPNSHTSFITPC